ncbi:MAG TPA: DUF4282 domain-containing protein [Candidatus Limnocylindrales bacterium]|nr:DUF4282 domain-containing protein [Candidatus Limnocylindrales bacterium]
MEPTPPPTSSTGYGAPRQPSGFDWGDFINFRYLVTPGFVTIIYVIGAIFITLAALATLANGSGGAVIFGILLFIFGNLYWRVILEFIIVLFRINEGIQSIDRRGRM